jgi:CBS domain-containing protein
MARKLEPAPQLLVADHTLIGEIMTRGAITIRADVGLELLVELFLEHGISRVPVVDEEGRPIGVVSKTDLVLDQHDRGDTEVDQLGAGGPERHVHEADRLVRDVMTPIAYTLPASMTIGEAARRMLADNVHAVPVTSEQGQVIGYLSATDFVAWVGGVHFGPLEPASPER